jgi:hypothetical protein
MDANRFIHNCNAHEVEDLAPYEEQHVAWSEDGKEILAHAPTLAELFREIDHKKLTRYVIGFIPSGEVSDLGGGAL